MATFLLAWNPNRWLWQDLAEIADAVRAGGRETISWSCGNSRQPQEGDRAFFIRLGRPPRGIFASGVIVAGSYEDLHWEDARAQAGETTRYVEVELDSLLDPEVDAILPRELLDTGVLSRMHWDTQRSGIRIPDPVASALEDVWADFSGSVGFMFPNEAETSGTIHEGAVRRTWVNAYERSAAARRVCIEAYGTACSVCDFDFGRTYGDLGTDFIHVHHLRSLADIGEEYEVDPIRDLRPVCPNCHAMIHRRRPAYTIEEIRGFMENAYRP